jgi:hypothetical protein
MGSDGNVTWRCLRRSIADALGQAGFVSGPSVEFSAPIDLRLHDGTARGQAKSISRITFEWPANLLPNGLGQRGCFTRGLGWAALMEAVLSGQTTLDPGAFSTPEACLPPATGIYRVTKDAVLAGMPW